MINFDLRATSPLGKMLRAPFRLLPSGFQVPILAGKARGMKWIYGSGPHGCWLGISEKEKRGLVQKLVQPGQVFYDLGANVGYYSLIASTLVGEKGRVLAFEPSPRNLNFLHQHLTLNHIRNVEIFPLAVSDKKGVAKFDDEADPVARRLDAQGKISVETVCLDDFIRENHAPLPHAMKIDVEGAELAVLHGARQIIADARPLMFVETHDRFVPGVHQACVEFLEGLNYRVETFGPDVPPTEIIGYPS